MENREKITLAVVMPVFNEEKTIHRVVAEWIALLSSLGIPFRLAVYDDGSTDTTPALLDQLAARYAAVEVHRTTNTGHGPTILLGYLDNRDAEWILQVDSDDEVSAVHFGAFWEQRKAYDFVIANRQGRQARFLRRLFSRTAAALVHTLYGGTVRDVNAPYRLMRVAAFAPCYQAIPTYYFAPNLAVTGYAARHGVPTLELPVPHRSAATGAVATSTPRIVKGAVRSLWQIVSFRTLCAKLEPRP